MDFTDLLQDEDKLVKRSTLFVGIIVGIIVLLTANAAVVVVVPQWRLRQFPVDLLVIGVWIGFWFFNHNRLPKNKTTKVGIVVVLSTENQKEKVRYKNDLVRRLGELIFADKLQKWVTIIPVTNHQAMKIIPVINAHADAIASKDSSNITPKLEKDWQRIRETINGHFYIYGSVSERGGEEENAYYLNTHAFVVHPPLTPELQRRLSTSFSDIWVREFNFLEKIEKVGFDFTATYWYTGAQYMVGFAALASGDISTALRLHEATQNKIDVLKIKPTFARTQKQLNNCLGAEYALTAAEYERKGDFQTAREYINKCSKIDPTNYTAYLLTARIEFAEGQPKKALKTIQQLQRVAGRDRTWMYSEAFLLLYLEDFKKGLASYRRIANYKFQGELENVVPQIITFNESQLKKEPDKIQSDFILGFIKMKKSRNYPEALEHFETFLTKATDAKYRPLVEEAKKCVTELHNIMQLDE